MSRCAWKTICQYLEVSLSEKLQPAGILSIATAGDFLNWNPHIHALVASGVFRADSSFVTVPLFQENVLRQLFEANVFKIRSSCCLCDMLPHLIDIHYIRKHASAMGVHYLLRGAGTVLLVLKLKESRYANCCLS